MIKLKQDFNNNVVLTLRETTTLKNPYYVFEFTNDDSNFKKVFTGVDVSTNIARYNEFVIELNPVEDLENSVIDLTKGFYDYKVYSTETQNDLDISNASELVECGIVYVEGDEQLTKTTYTGGNDTKVVYNG
jgi:hypothetical protein